MAGVTNLALYPIGTSALAPLSRNAGDLDKLINGTGTVENRAGGILTTWQKLEADFGADATAVLSNYAAFNNTGDWVTGTAYQVNDLWKSGGNWYLVLEAYTSGATAADDIAGGTVALYQSPGTVWQVGSIADIELLGALEEGQAIYLSAGGRSGTFHWDSSDLSAEVAADTLQGVYIAPSGDATGASGAWVRKLDGLLSFAWFFDDYSASFSSDSALIAAAGVAAELGFSLYVPHLRLLVSAYPNLGDVVVFSDGCELIGGYPRAKELRGFVQAGVRDAEYAILPRRSIAGRYKKIFYAESSSKVWAIIPNAKKSGGKAIRLRSSGAPSLSGPNDAGVNYDRIRQDLIYDITTAFTMISTPLATSGTWSDTPMTSGLWPDADGGTNLLQSQNIKKNDTAAGSYIEYSVDTDNDKFFNVGFYSFSSASDSVDIYDQTNGVLIDTIDLTSGGGESSYLVKRFEAPKLGNLTLRIINNGVTNTDLRVLGVNIYRLFSDDNFNKNAAPDSFNFVRLPDAFFSSGSAGTPVYTVRQGGSGGSGITAGSIHGGETGVSVSWVVDGVEVSDLASMAAGSIYTGDALSLIQNTNITWPDSQTADYREELEFIADGAVDCTAILSSVGGVRIQNSYNGMAPLPTKFDTITFPRLVDLGSPGVSDVLYYPAVTGENMISLSSSVDGDTVDFYYSVYPDTQSRNYPGAISVNMAAITDGYCKVYATQYLGADKEVNNISSRSIVVYS